MILNETYTLSNSVKIPKLGLGTWMLTDGEAAQAVRDAVAMGYRHIDTAQAYGNEAGVGDGVRSCGVARDELFVTSKVAAENKSYDSAAQSIDETLRKTGLDCIDMMIIHSPQPWAEFRGEKRYFEENREVWRALEDAYKAGKVRAIGVSNFLEDDLENILNEAAINAAKSKRKFITNADVNYAFVKVGIGVEKRSKIISEKEKKITAYHESGHAILFHVLPDVGPVHTISIIPTGMGAAGYTMPLPEKDEMFNTKGKMLQNIIVSLGGRVAEELIFDDITTGASQDIKQATATARDMVTKYGFSDRLGLINYASSDEDEVFIGRDLAHTRPYGEDIATAIDEEVKNIIDDCYAQAKKIISEHMDVLEKSSELLLEKEKVTREEFEALFDNGSGTDDDGIMGTTIVSVSYTHLTLPTILLV